MVAPSQYGPALLAAGMAGLGLTTTIVSTPRYVEPSTVTVTEYVPASAVVAFVRVGFCCDDVKPFGPVQAYAAPVTVGAKSWIVAPSQYGPPLVGAGVAG